jgi:small nuclear ribonucleoprotein (snRNP)-like protein
MSKILKELLAATELKAVRNEDQQDTIKRVMKGVEGLNDKAWEGLSQDAQDWFNSAADALNAKKKVLPYFPDAEESEPEKEEPKASRRGASKEADKPAEPKLKDVVKITTKRGKTETGTVVEIDDEVIVLKYGNGEEAEFNRDRLESIEVAGGNDAGGDDEPDDGIKVGAEVTVVTKRGKEVTGKLVEMDDEFIVLDVDGKDEGKAKADAKEEPKSSRRGASKEADKPADEKPKRASNGEVSIGTRIKELIADDLEATEADIAKILKKEGLEFRENTLKLNFVDCHKFLVILKAKKLIK